MWTLVRALAFVAAAWLVWRFVHETTGVPSLLCAIGLALFGLLVKARPERKSIDDVARTLNALVVLNGGSWINERDSKAVPDTSIFVVSDRLVVLTAKFLEIAEIPLAGVREVHIHAVSRSPRTNGHAAAEAWQMEINWASANGARSAAFRFDGFFAEHLARVAEQTVTSVWKKQLPVLKS
ncbi:MAG TPA: hypothetical protein VMT20_22265 [Terriglobia bacterium]|nr:hypothetical protein [Terriglobia bacterium]